MTATPTRLRLRKLKALDAIETMLGFVHAVTERPHTVHEDPVYDTMRALLSAQGNQGQFHAAHLAPFNTEESLVVDINGLIMETAPNSGSLLSSNGTTAYALDHQEEDPRDEQSGTIEMLDSQQEPPSTTGILVHWPSGKVCVLAIWT